MMVICLYNGTCSLAQILLTVVVDGCGNVGSFVCETFSRTCTDHVQCSLLLIQVAEVEEEDEPDDPCYDSK